jgi:allene oxide cyclase
MRTRRLVLGAVGGLAGVLAVGIAIATASSPQVTSPQTIHVIEEPIKLTFTDLGKKGPSQGDTFVATNVLHEPGDRSKVLGHEDDTCTLVAVKAFRFSCTGTAFFKGGSLMAQGPFALGRSNVLAVTGGTGKFQNARGQVVAVDLGHDRVDDTWQVIP